MTEDGVTFDAVTFRPVVDVTPHREWWDNPTQPYRRVGDLTGPPPAGLRRKSNGRPWVAGERRRRA